ncbi:MAG: DNA-binding transcriptional LysR family regulator [Gammaproteobacteria bacterium]
MTPGAIAQPIKTLEQWASAPSFERMSQGVQLTEIGQNVVAELGEAFDILGTAAAKLRTHHQSQQLRIAVLPSIAQLWLSPRLPLLRIIDPTKTISITALDRRPNLLREPYDLSLFFYEKYQLKGVSEICRDPIFPVFSSNWADKLKSPVDLDGSVFLHDTKWKDDWSNWIGKVIPGCHMDVSGPEFSLYS